MLIAAFQHIKLGEVVLQYDYRSLINYPVTSKQKLRVMNPARL